MRSRIGLTCCAVFYWVHFSSTVITTCTAILPMLEHRLLASPLWLSIYWVFVVLAAVCHLRCMVTEPGSLPKNSDDNDKAASSSRFCTKCKCLKVMRAHHCSVCNKCVMRMDHHCPWVNNCVGLRTARHYLLYVLYLFIVCWFSVALLLTKVVICWAQIEEELCDSGQDLRIFASFYAFFMCFIFGVFLGFLLHDQVMHAITGTTAIENLQRYNHSSV